MLSVSSSEDEGGPGSSGRLLGSGSVSNSILEVLSDGRGVESSKEGATSIDGWSFSGGGISIGRVMGVRAFRILSSLPGKMKREEPFRDRNQGAANLVEMEQPCFQTRKRILAQVNEPLVALHRWLPRTWSLRVCGLS